MDAMRRGFFAGVSFMEHVDGLLWCLFSRKYGSTQHLPQPIFSVVETDMFECGPGRMNLIHVIVPFIGKGGRSRYA